MSHSDLCSFDSDLTPPTTPVPRNLRIMPRQSEQNDEEQVSYSGSEEWADITPVPQADPGTQVLVPILYPQDYKEAMDYFRAVVQAGEYSQRVLTLTEDIIKMNPAHYTVWQYRYQTLLRTNSSLEAELELTHPIAIKHMKNYQVWHHRRLLLQHLNGPPPGSSPSAASTKEIPDSSVTEKILKELEFTAKVLSHDTKNYHTWAYRQWILAEFNQPELWEHELELVESMLSDDVRNNSAWHHRFFMVWETGVKGSEEIDRDRILRREIEYTKDQISIAPNNASSWNYLRGILRKTHTPFSTLEEFVLPYTRPQPDESVTQDQATVDLENPLPSKEASLPAPLAIEFLADVLLEKDEKEKAIELFGSLATEYDTIRKRYWEYRQRKASEQ